jgi:CBS domain-containing protein
MKRSILTEKVARRGYHVSREYSVDALETLSVGEVMTTRVITVPASLPVKDLLGKYFFGTSQPRHQGFPVVDADGNLLGVITRSNFLEHWVSAILQPTAGGDLTLTHPIIGYDLVDRLPITAYPWESCRTAAERMSQTGVGRLPVVSPEDPRKVVGLVTRSDLLKGRARFLEEESKRERFIGTRGRGAVGQGAARGGPVSR